MTHPWENPPLEKTVQPVRSIPTPFWQRAGTNGSWIKDIKIKCAQAQVVWMMKSFQDVTFLFGEASIVSWCVGCTVEKPEKHVGLLDPMQLTHLLFLAKIWNTHLATWSFNDSFWTWVKRTSSWKLNSIFCLYLSCYTRKYIKEKWNRRSCPSNWLTSYLMLLVPDVNGTKLIHQQWNPPPLCTEFTKVSLRVAARHDIKRSTLKNIANLSTWLHPPKRTMVHLNIPSWKRRKHLQKLLPFFGVLAVRFSGVQNSIQQPPVFVFCRWWNEITGWNLQAPCFGIVFPEKC